MNQDEDYDEIYFYDHFYNDTEIHNYSLHGNVTSEPWMYKDDYEDDFVESSGIFSVNEQSDYGIFSSRKSSLVKKNIFCQTCAPPLNIFFCNVEII